VDNVYAFAVIKEEGIGDDAGPMIDGKFHLPSSFLRG
jgi:hypothetical protein